MQKRRALFWELFITDCWQVSNLTASDRWFRDINVPYSTFLCRLSQRVDCPHSRSRSSTASSRRMWTRRWRRMGRPSRLVSGSSSVPSSGSALHFLPGAGSPVLESPIRGRVCLRGRTGHLDVAGSKVLYHPRTRQESPRHGAAQIRHRISTRRSGPLTDDESLHADKLSPPQYVPDLLSKEIKNRVNDVDRSPALYSPLLFRACNLKPPQ